MSGKHDIHELLSQKTWAVIGVSNNTAKYGYKVYTQFRKASYLVFAINPRLQSIDGDLCYLSLAALPTRPDAVCLVVPPKITEQVIREVSILESREFGCNPVVKAKRLFKVAKNTGLQ